MHTADSLKREVGRAFRSLARSPGFTLIVLITLALGIGATTAIFTMLDQVVLHPLPFADSNQLVWIDSPTPGVKPDSKWGLSVAEFFYFKKNAHSLENIAAIMPGEGTVTGKQAAERVHGAQVSASIFDVLRLRPILGRTFKESDDLLHAPPVTIVGYNYWKTRLNGDPHVIGSIIHVNTIPMQIVGVMGPDATIPDAVSPQVDIWVPAEIDPNAKPVDSHYLPIIGRLAANATVSSAQAELAQLTRQLARAFPDIYTAQFFRSSGFRTAVTPLQQFLIGDIAKRLWILIAAVGLVLIIACGNIANLFLVRAEARQREVAIRSALGAKRSDLARQYFTESIVVALIGGVAALVLAYIGLHVLIALAPPDLPRIGEVQLGWLSVLFTFLLSIAVGAVFGGLALAGTESRDDSMMLREGGRGMTSSKRQHFVRGVLISAQTAFALVLLVAAGLMLQSFRNMRNVSPGFNPANVLTAEISLPDAQYSSYEKVEAFYHALLTRAAATPGVHVATLGSVIPLGNGESENFAACASVFVEDHPLAPGEEAPCVDVPIVAPGYFRALGITVRGAEPGWSDVESRSGDVVVTQALAERLWPGQDAIGKGIRGNGDHPPYYRVVGVANNFRATGLDKPPPEAVFFPLLPIPKAWLWSPRTDVTILLRTNGVPPQTLSAPLRRLINGMDPNVPIANIRTMDEVVAQSMTRLSFTMTLLGIAALMALILSAVGIYGVISYIVGRRTSEIGIRMALGAQASRVGSQVVFQSLKLTAIGVVIGVIAALGLTRALRSLLFDVSPTDPITLLSVSAIMLIIAALASYIPAQRAMNVDPVEALRAD